VRIPLILGHLVVARDWLGIFSAGDNAGRNSVCLDLERDFEQHATVD
jgi:hypothetical protein